MNTPEPLYTAGYVAKNRLIGFSSITTVLSKMEEWTNSKGKTGLRWIDMSKNGDPKRMPRIPASSINEYIQKQNEPAKRKKSAAMI